MIVILCSRSNGLALRCRASLSALPGFPGFQKGRRATLRHPRDTGTPLPLDHVLRTPGARARAGALVLSCSLLSDTHDFPHDSFTIDLCTATEFVQTFWSPFLLSDVTWHPFIRSYLDGIRSNSKAVFGISLTG